MTQNKTDLLCSNCAKLVDETKCSIPAMSNELLCQPCTEKLGWEAIDNTGKLDNLFKAVKEDRRYIPEIKVMRKYL